MYAYSLLSTQSTDTQVSSQNRNFFVILLNCLIQKIRGQYWNQPGKQKAGFFS